MTSRFATVKLNTRLVDEARREAEIFHRSLSGQIEHWAQLGRALENTSGVTLPKVRAALAGELRIEDLADAEQDAFFAGLASEFDPPSADLKARYAELQDRRAADLKRRTAPRKRGAAA